MALQTVDQLREENRVLKNELERLEELLVVSRAERDQIGIRYNAISERVSSLPSAVQWMAAFTLTVACSFYYVFSY